MSRSTRGRRRIRILVIGFAECVGEVASVQILEGLNTLEWKVEGD